ncbi:MAG: CHAT domain-containing protein [Desulfobacteraceae bacterium]|nr:CHAT domain-containing protein [Desulfobacteraceae bacterium]
MQQQMTNIRKLRNMNPSQVLHLEASLEEDRVKISLAVQRTGETQTVRQVEDLTVSMDLLNRRCALMLDSLNQANRRGQLPPDVLERLAESGQLFRDELFSATIKERLNIDTAEALVLTLDDHLVHLPWELLHDGQRFLGQQFAMGRVVRTRQQVTGGPLRALVPPLRMLVLADPCGDLNAAYEEGVHIRDVTESRHDIMKVDFRSTGVQTDFVKAKLRQFDLVHFAGHADFSDAHARENGWCLGNGCLTAEDIRRMAGTGNMPALIFANACQSARTRPWPSHAEVQTRFFDLANAFLLSGVRHYLGTFWEIPDEQSEDFALSFYKTLLAGDSVGAAVLAARRKIIARFGDRSIVWASYLLYGDPTTTYFQPADAADEKPPAAAAKPMQPVTAVASGVRSPEDTLRLHARRTRRSAVKRWVLATLVLLLLAAGAWVFMPGTFRDAVKEYERNALTAYETGQYEQVKRICMHLQREHPRRALGYVLMANVDFLNGDLDNARTLYHQAVQADQGQAMEKADALIGLGRIASEQGNTDQALALYRQAAEMAPSSDQPLMAQALLKHRSGQPEQAVAFLNKAKPVASDVRAIEALTLQIQANAAMAADQQRMDRIDRLIRELGEKLEKDAPILDNPMLPQDPRSLTLWLNDLETVGYSLREGTATLIASGLMERLLQTRHIKIVERVLLDGLMNEIKLGTTRLMDPNTRLQLGRLTAAHTILTGRVVHSAPDIQISLRCIETVTGQVFAVINATFNSQTPIAVIVDHISDDLISKIHTHYPLLTRTDTAVID